MKIYTKKGDQGKTTLVDGAPIDKTNKRLVAYGTLDELNSHVGLMLTHLIEHKSLFSQEWDELISIQNWLFQLGSQLACANPDMASKLPTISPTEIAAMEESMDHWDEELPPLKNFILPGGHVAAAEAHVCRTICRRAERCCVMIDDLGQLPAVAFLNRMSDYFFVLARLINHRLGVPSTEWIP